MRIKIICIIILITISFSQLQQGGTPLYMLLNEQINFINVDHSKIIDRDLHPMVLRYANEYSVDINFPDLATKIEHANESTLYLGIQSSGAMALAFDFDEFNLTENTKMFIYDEHKSMYIGSFNSKNNSPIGSLSTAVVKGDKVVIELTIPNNELPKLKLHMNVVTHDFLDLMNFQGSATSDRDDCNDNVACSSADDWGDQVDAVVLVSSNGGVCSAAIVNNTAFDLEPYILYAAHCNSGGSSTVYFNYQAYSCSGGNPGSYDTMSGTQNLAVGNFSNNDYALIKLNNDIPSSYGAYFAGWNRSTSNPGNNVVGIHHPDGWIKKISYDAYGMGSNGNWWDFGYSSGRIIPGSSGSPFFDSDKRIRGMASYIYTDYCSPSPDCYCSQSYYHGYAKFSSAWNYIDDYLDPINSNEWSIDGTYDGIVYGCSDAQADNYDPDAIGCEDGSNNCCEYASVTLSFGESQDNSIQMILTTPGPVPGFQFMVTTTNDFVITGVSGGISEELDFTVSSSEIGIVIGFHFGGIEIPAGTHVLTNIAYEGLNSSDFCLTDAVVTGYEVDYGDCVTVTAVAQSTLSIGAIFPGTLEILMDNPGPVAGFQFEIISSNDGFEILGADGGAAGDLGFIVSTNTLQDENTSIVIGFDMQGDEIMPMSNGVLTELDYSASEDSEICIENGIITGFSVNYGPCADITAGTSGDLNNDGNINVVDVVIMVNGILDPETITPEIQSLGDMNLDGLLNVVDVVILVNLILGN